MSTTFQPKTKRGKTRHGFLKRQATAAGKNVIKNRRQKGRKKLTTV